MVRAHGGHFNLRLIQADVGPNPEVDESLADARRMLTEGALAKDVRRRTEEEEAAGRLRNMLLPSAGVRVARRGLSTM